MLALLENPAIRHRAMPVSLKLYHRLGELALISEKTELLDGVIIEKTHKTPLHVYLTMALFRLLEEAISPGLAVRDKAPLTFMDLCSEPEPDLAVVEGDHDDYMKAHPATARLVVEVCAATEEIDRAKATLYARAAIPECWLVIAERAEVEILRAPSAEGYAEHRVFHRGETAESTELSALRVAVNDLFPSA